MTHRVVYTDEAIANIEQAVDWWAEHHSSSQAVTWYEGIYEQIETLAEMPERFALARENQQFPYDLRQMLYGVSKKPTHRVLYTIRPDMVLIIAVLHARQDDLKA